VTVPVHYRDGAAMQRSELAQTVGQPRDAFVQRRIGLAVLVAVDDLLIGRVGERRVQQMLDQQRITYKPMGSCL
jgi:hypothetical protein